VVLGLRFCGIWFAQLTSGKVQVVATANMCREVGSTTKAFIVVPQV
jgi:hypothetical protein